MKKTMLVWKEDQVSETKIVPYITIKTIFKKEFLMSICVPRPQALVLSPCPRPGHPPNLYLINPAPNLCMMGQALVLYLPAAALNFCLPVLCFTVCYSYSAYFYKLSVC